MHHRASLSPPFDLSKELFSYSEAMARPDASVWQAAMDCECQSLIEIGVFEEADLPPGEWTIGLKWVYAYKIDASGMKIPGKENISKTAFYLWVLGAFLNSLRSNPRSPQGLYKFQHLLLGHYLNFQARSTNFLSTFHSFSNLILGQNVKKKALSKFK